MKKSLVTVACALAAVVAFSVAPVNPKVVPFGVDVVSAATGEAPAKPTTPTTKPTTPTTKPTTTPTTTTAKITTTLKLGSKGNDVKTLQTALNAKGYKLTADGKFGAKTAAAVKDFQKKSGLKETGIVDATTVAKLFPAAAPAVTKTTLKIGRADYAAHGTKSFATAVVVMAGDKIVATSLDEYQFSAATGYVGVPNSDKDFGKNYPEGQVLQSKLLNSDAYSANMKKSAGATLAWSTSIDSIRKFATGKTLVELQAAIITTSKEDIVKKVDAVSSATLADTQGYLNAIVEAAKNAVQVSDLQVDIAQLGSLKVGEANFAAHGTKCFTTAVTVLAGDQIVATSLTDYQFTAPTGYIPVPNSDKDFGKSYPAGQVLVSKLLNSDAYSAHMKESAGAKYTWAQNMASIQKYSIGKTLTALDLKVTTTAKTDMVKDVDAVSSATFVDTDGYVKAIVAAAKAAK